MTNDKVMWFISVFDSFNSDMVYYKFDEPLPYKLSLAQMRTLLTSSELTIDNRVDGCDCPIIIRLRSTPKPNN